MWFAVPQTSRKGQAGCPLNPRTHALSRHEVQLGRPSKTEKRDQQLNIKLTLRELATIRARASAACLRPVDYGRAQLLADGLPHRAASAASSHLDTLFLLQLSRLGNNLNQIARKLNRTGVLAPAALDALLAEIRDVIRKASRDDS